MKEVLPILKANICDKCVKTYTLKYILVLRLILHLILNILI